MGFLFSIVWFIVRKLALPALAAVAVWAGTAAWLAWQDGNEFETHQRSWLATLSGKREQLRASIADIEKRKAMIMEEIAAQEERVKQAGRVITTLHELESAWDRYVGNPAQQKANAEQIVRMEEMKAGAEGHVAELRQEFRRKTWERSGLEVNQRGIDDEIAYAEQHSSKTEYYPDQAWRRAKWGILAAPVAVLLLGWLLGLRKFWKTIPDRR